jgi:hypothetical protein
MFTLGDAYSEMELRKEILTEVEGYRLAKLATGREVGWRLRVLGMAAVRGGRRVMVGLGRSLECFGCQLQEWFASESARTTR